MNAWLRNLDGRWLAVCMVGAYFGILLVGYFIFHQQFWNYLGVAALEHPFHDLRDIATGIERFRNSADPWSPDSLAYSIDAYSYTKWWLFAGYLGLSLQTVFVLGLGMGALFFFCSLYVLGRLSMWEGGVAGLVLISPNVMTAIERANADLLIFSLLALAIALRRSIPLSTAVITLAAFLKIYPATALAGIARPPWRKTLPWLLAAIALLAIDVVTSLDEFHHIASTVVRIRMFSYGSTTFMEVYKETRPMAPPLTYKAYAVGSLMFLAVVGLAAWGRPRANLKPGWEKELLAFRVGAAVFLGTFALGSNLDYRTVVFIFCLPLLFRLRKEPGPIATWAFIALFAIVFYTCNRFFLDDAVPILFFLKQVIAWFLVALIAGIAAGTFNRPSKS